MKKILLRFWYDRGGRFGGNSCCVTLRLTPTVGTNWDDSFFQVWEGGLVIIPCDEYVVIESKSSPDYESQFKLCFDGTALSIRAIGRESLTFGLPQIEE